ncbi:MAG TPA: hypothetical protein VM938_01715 [Acidimicrobiales bacterium]|nr:hypothetical protein [Acidimicrobiales bacterium]
MADVTQTLKDAAYVAVGFGVIGFQKAQVRRQELRKDLAGRQQELNAQVEEYGAKLRDLAGRVEPVVTDLQQRIEPMLDELEGRLPEQAKGFVQQARQAAKAALGSTAPAAV